MWLYQHTLHLVGVIQSLPSKGHSNERRQVRGRHAAPDPSPSMCAVWNEHRLASYGTASALFHHF